MEVVGVVRVLGAVVDAVGSTRVLVVVVVVVVTVDQVSLNDVDDVMKWLLTIIIVMLMTACLH